MDGGNEQGEALRGNRSRDWQILLHAWPKTGHGELSKGKQPALGHMPPPSLLGTGASFMGWGRWLSFSVLEGRFVKD